MNTIKKYIIKKICKFAFLFGILMLISITNKSYAQNKYTYNNANRYSFTTAGSTNSYDNKTNEPRWDFTIDDNNNEANDMFNWWINGGNSVNDIMMQLIGSNNSTDKTTDYTKFRLVTPRLLVTRKISEQGLDNLMFNVDGNNSYIESTGDENGMHISSKTGNKIQLGDSNDIIGIGINPVLGKKLYVNGDGRYDGSLILSGGVNRSALGSYLLLLPGNEYSEIRSVGYKKFTLSSGNGKETGTGNKVQIGDYNDSVGLNAENLTINTHSSSKLAKVSINTAAKVDKATLTIAGATYIGPKAEKASTGTLDKFKADYLKDYNLWVEDGIVTEDIIIVAVNQWKDDIFKEGYDLKSLAELENYIKTNGHLPGVKTEAEVKKEGYSLKNMDVTLLGKVEELTLYTIAQEKKIKLLEEKMGKYEKMENEISKLKELILSTQK